MRLRWLLAIALAGIASNAAARACGEEFGGPRRLEGDRYVVAYVAVPAPIVVGAHFAVDFVVCPRAGIATPDSVRVDAMMPEHRHGMNYRPEIVAAKNGRYRAVGLLFHMSGRWELTFDLTTTAGTERLTETISVE